MEQTVASKNSSEVYVVVLIYLWFKIFLNQFDFDFPLFQNMITNTRQSKSNWFQKF